MYVGSDEIIDYRRSIKVKINFIDAISADKQGDRGQAAYKFP